MQEDVWIPNRDFRSPEELINRIRHFENNPMKPLKFEERLDQINNNVRNLTLMLNQMQQTLTQLQQKQNGAPGFNNQQAPSQVAKPQPQQ